jgi:hypothetical protein
VPWAPRLVERLPNSNPSFTTPYPNPCILRASRHTFHGRSHADHTRPSTAHLHHDRPGLRQACLRARAPQPRASRCQGNRHTSTCNIQHTASWPRAPRLPASCCCPETPAPLGARLQSVSCLLRAGSGWSRRVGITFFRPECASVRDLACRVQRSGKQVPSAALLLCCFVRSGRAQGGPHRRRISRLGSVRLGAGRARGRVLQLLLI